MGLQKYRADVSHQQEDKAIVWKTTWMGGPSLAKIENCRWENLYGQPRQTVYITGEADTWFSIPAALRFGRVTVKGYVTYDAADNFVFRHGYY